MPESCEWKLQISANLLNWRTAFDNQTTKERKVVLSNAVTHFNGFEGIPHSSYIIQTQFNIQIPYSCFLMLVAALTILCLNFVYGISCMHS